jgi:hypothetical protein
VQLEEVACIAAREPEGNTELEVVAASEGATLRLLLAAETEQA